MARLWWIMLAGSALLFLVTMLLFAMVMLRPSWGARLGPGRWIVFGGLGLPALVLPPLAGYSLWIGERVVPAGMEDAVRIEVIAERWSWTFRYPDHGGAETVDLLHLPAGVPVELRVTSLDVIHSFWVPRLAGKRDAIPGQINAVPIRVDAAETGIAAEVEGQCAEYCGIGHASMRFEVRVHPPEALAAALAAEPRAAPPEAPDAPPLPEGPLPEPLR